MEQQSKEFSFNESLLTTDAGDLTADINALLTPGTSDSTASKPKRIKREKTSEEKERESKIYFNYDPKNFQAAFLFRTANDIVTSAIIHSGSEGIGRYEIGRKLGINTRLKRGNRKVSAHILAVTKALPDQIGQFQKQEGKYRNIRYYYKENQPDRLTNLLERFKEVAGVDLPFKIEESLKFPETKLNTLRISDVTINRFIYIMELVVKERVVITISKMVKHIQKVESEKGYNFEADKKSIMKCLLALERKGLIHLFSTDIEADDIAVKTFEVITAADITSVSSPEVKEAIDRSITAFHAENRIFPTNVIRIAAKHQTLDELKVSGIDINSLDPNHMSIEERYFMSRAIIFSGAIESRNWEVKRETLDSSMEPGPSPSPPEHSASFDQSFEYLEEESIEAKPIIPTTSTDPSGYDPSVNYGYQSGKMIRCCILHEFAWHFVYFKPNPRPSGLEMPTYFERFPPGVRLPAEGVPFEVLSGEDPETSLVYDREEDSPYRYVPPLPPFRDVQQGWFMIRDLMMAMPLSIHLLICKKMTRMPELDKYLNDPIRRHTLISDLPEKLRNILINKRSTEYIDHLCTILCGCGLMKCGKALESKSTLSGSFFFIGKSTYLYDTSTSQRGYAKVTLPIESYDKYDYKFEFHEDIFAYWNHLKAIAQSTPLNLKSDKSDVEERELLSSRKYAVRSSEKNAFEIPYDEVVKVVIPPPPNEGCAGLDPSLYVHMKRQWDVDHHRLSEWYLQRLRKYAEFVRPSIESRIANPQKIWSGMSNFMSSDSKFYNTKDPEPILNRQTLKSLKLGVLKRKSTASIALVKRPKPVKKQTFEYIEPSEFLTDQDPLVPGTVTNTEVIQTLAEALASLDKTTSAAPGPSSQFKMPTTIKREPGVREVAKKKRAYDEIDIISQRRSVKIRAQFTPQEKDMLILIRAVSFFLNPVYRFWLEPTVVRDVMHEFVPDSRTKTVQSLMAAAVREMGKPNRLAHLQYIVKTLSSYKQMREIRNTLAAKSFPKEDTEQKRQFFHTAFEVAHRLLFQETQRLPSHLFPDQVFNAFLASNNVTVSTKVLDNTPKIPIRSQKPETIEHVQICVAFNAIMMLFLNESRYEETDEDMILSKLIDTLSAKALTQVLDKLRVDGLISKAKITSDDQTRKGKATISLYYRHFFNHRYRNDLLDLARDAVTSLEAPRELIMEDDPGVLVVLSGYLDKDPDKRNLEIQIPDSVADIFDVPDETFLCKDTKQLRSLENAELHVENIRVESRLPVEFEDIPSVDELLNVMVLKVPFEAITQHRDLDEIVALFDEEDRLAAHSVYKEIWNSNALGRSLKELEESVHFDSKHIVERILNILVQNYTVFECGVDTHRYVTMPNAKSWMMTTAEYGFFIRPWCSPSGDVNPVILRWMAEGVLFTVFTRPGISIKELEGIYGFVLQPVLLGEILALLDRVGTIKIMTKFIAPIVKANPFEKVRVREETKYVMPIENGIERFARIFGHIEMPEYLYMNIKRKDANN